MTLTSFDWTTFAFLLQFVGWAIIMVWGIVYIPFPRTTAVAQAWLLLFLFLPWIAMLLYAVFGRTGHPAWRRERFARVPSIVERTIGRPAGLDRDLPRGVGTNFRRTAGLVERIGGLPCVGGNAIDLDAGYERVVRRIVEDIDGARDHVHVVFYIFHADEAGNQVLDALERAAARGVTCRLLIDAVGSSRHRRRIAERLKGTGVELALILPLRLWTRATRFDLRNHRKIVVVDEAIGWVGSQNMHRREYEPATFYRDVMARITGPAVSELQAVFLGDWFLKTDREVILYTALRRSERRTRTLARCCR